VSARGEAGPPEQRERVLWLDVFRGAAVVAMIEAHVVNTFLAPALRETAWFAWLNWFNGLVAPSFLFIAGWAQGLSWSAAVGKPVAFARKAKRLLGIAALGFALHFPWGELAQRRWDAALRIGTQVDVLPCLAASLLAVLGMQWLAQRGGARGRAGIYFTLLGALMVGIVWVGPPVVAWTAGPVPVVAWVNQTTGSLFPLPTWAGFAFAGAMLGAVRGLPAVALLGVFAAVRTLGWWLNDGVFSVVSAASFCERLALVAALAALCQWVVRVWKPGALLFAGRESLVMYAGHLLLISWTVQAGVPDGAFGWPAVAGLYVAVLAATWVVALGWAKWQARRPKAGAQAG
jgi:uncharacterized membrane protein